MGLREAPLEKCRGPPRHSRIVWLVVVGVFLILAISATWFICFLEKSRKIQEDDIEGLRGTEHTNGARGNKLSYNVRKFCKVRISTFERTVPRMSLHALLKATSNFSKDAVIGYGKAGSIHKARLPEGSSLAIKRVHDSELSNKEFMSEMMILGCLRHRNLLPLLGFCIARNERLLIFEHMPRGREGYIGAAGEMEREEGSPSLQSTLLVLISSDQILNPKVVVSSDQVDAAAVAGRERLWERSRGSYASSLDSSGVTSDKSSWPFGQDPEISTKAREYARWMTPCLSAYGLLQCQVIFLQSQNIVFPMSVSSGMTALFHLLVYWILVFKSGLGSKGAALANSILKKEKKKEEDSNNDGGHEKGAVARKGERVRTKLTPRGWFYNHRFPPPQKETNIILGPRALSSLSNAGAQTGRGGAEDGGGQLQIDLALQVGVGRYNQARGQLAGREIMVWHRST
ncbi:hypothetical protein ACLOJK_021906 [Asimina triloba]